MKVINFIEMWINASVCVRMCCREREKEKFIFIVFYKVYSVFIQEIQFALISYYFVFFHIFKMHGHNESGHFFKLKSM